MSSGRANVSKPRYPETVRKTANAEVRYVRQSGGKGQYGHVKIAIEPNDPAGYELEHDKGGVIQELYRLLTGAYRAPCCPGLGRLQRSGCEGHSLRRKLSRVDSSELAFKIAIHGL